MVDGGIEPPLLQDGLIEQGNARVHESKHGARSRKDPECIAPQRLRQSDVYDRRRAARIPSIELQAAFLRPIARDAPSKRRRYQEPCPTHAPPGGSPPVGNHRTSNAREGGDETDPYQQRINTHRMIQATSKPLSHKRQAGDRESTLAESSSQRDRNA